MNNDLYNTGAPCQGLESVLYEGQYYETVIIGPQCWIKENLNVGIRIDSTDSPSDDGIIEKWCYHDIPDSCDVYGGFYSWDEMLQWSDDSTGICPPSFHIPSHEEWVFLLDSILGDNDTASPLMKTPGILDDGSGLWRAPNEDATNSSGFTALPSGNIWKDGSSYHGRWSEMIAFWSTSIEEAYGSPNTRHIYELYYSHKQVSLSLFSNRVNGYSVRCIHNSFPYEPPSP